MSQQILKVFKPSNQLIPLNEAYENPRKDFITSHNSCLD